MSWNTGTEPTVEREYHVGIELGLRQFFKTFLNKLKYENCFLVEVKIEFRQNI